MAWERTRNRKNLIVNVRRFVENIIENMLSVAYNISVSFPQGFTAKD